MPSKHRVGGSSPSSITFIPRQCKGRTTEFGSVGRGSIPLRGTNKKQKVFLFKISNLGFEKYTPRFYPRVVELVDTRDLKSLDSLNRRTSSSLVSWTKLKSTECSYYSLMEPWVVGSSPTLPTILKSKKLWQVAQLVEQGVLHFAFLF